jgi:hypothetical protein
MPWSMPHRAPAANRVAPWLHINPSATRFARRGDTAVGLGAKIAGIR